MELRQLKAFVTVAKVHSFTRVAELLDYAQSSITAQISSLEDDLNTKLFERFGRQVTLTSAGKQLLVYAEKMLMLSSDAKDLISRKTPTGTLHIGVTETLSTYRLPPLLQEYHKLYSNVEFIIITGSPDDHIHWLKANEIDVAFLIAPRINSDLIPETLFHEPMGLFSGAGHPLIKKVPIAPHNIHGETLVLCAKSCPYREALEDILYGEDLHAGSIIQVGNAEALKKYVVNGFGITLLPSITVEEELAFKNHALTSSKACFLFKLI